MKTGFKILSFALLVVTFTACMNNQQSEDSNSDDKAVTYSKDKSKSDASMKPSLDGVPESKYSFDVLPYDYNALEPEIDTRTMKLHYDKHHKGYYKKFVNAIESTDGNGMEITDILSQISNYPLAVRNNAGGYYNHWLFWHSLSPEKDQKPSQNLMSALEESFGSWDQFQKSFENVASSQFGSGWGWLIVNENGNLSVVNTPNQDNPLMDVVEINGIPILALDVWEHAYYIKYKNKRTTYINNFWKIIDWSKVSKRYQDALKQKTFKP